MSDTPNPTKITPVQLALILFSYCFQLTPPFCENDNVLIEGIPVSQVKAQLDNRLQHSAGW